MKKDKAKTAALREYKRACRQEERDYAAHKRELKHGGARPPLMADVFDLIEGLRAEPNGRTPFNNEIKVEKDVIYKTVEGQNLLMDIYHPSCPVAERSPAIMYIPGGGWMIHNRRRRDGFARCLAVLGAVVAVIDHRLCPQVCFPQDLTDCVDAYNFLVENADKYSLDAANITVGGDSSGGHLAACLGCASSSGEYARELGMPQPHTAPSGMIFISGAFSFDVMHRIPFTHTLMVRHVCGQKNWKSFKNWKYYRHINPYNFLTSDFPASYNNGGATDFLCAGEAKRMSKKLDAVGVENEYRVGKSPFNCMHCYVLRLPFRSARRDMLRIFDWYRRRQNELGVNVDSGFKRVEAFMTDYKKTLYGRKDC